MKRFNLAVLARILNNLGKTHGLKGQAKREYLRIPSSERLTANDLFGATITVSNIGSLYKAQTGYFSLLEIIPPQVAVVGLGAIQEKPGVFQDANGQPAIGIRKIMPICITFDHRALDFQSVVPLIQRLDEIFAHPDEIYGW